MKEIKGACQVSQAAGGLAALGSVSPPACGLAGGQELLDSPTRAHNCPLASAPRFAGGAKGASGWLPGPTLDFCLWIKKTHLPVLMDQVWWHRGYGALEESVPLLTPPPKFPRTGSHRNMLEAPETTEAATHHCLILATRNLVLALPQLGLSLGQWQPRCCRNGRRWAADGAI